MTSAFCFGESVKSVVLHLSVFMLTLHLFAQLVRASIALCNILVATIACSCVHHITRSSAYIATFIPYGSSATRSLMKTKKKVLGKEPLPGGHHVSVESSYS